MVAGISLTYYQGEKQGSSHTYAAFGPGGCVRKLILGLFVSGLAACGASPDNEQVIAVARHQLRAGLAGQVGLSGNSKDASLDEVIEKSRFAIEEPCQSHAQLPDVYVCGVKVRVALPVSNTYRDNEMMMPVVMAKSRNGSWVDAMTCEGDVAPIC